ncbi:MAG: thioredoxin family protein [Gammaproteobacteria bacterium]|nr:thioredoxin family protein [Gammaproteobacteria bacterium]
MAVFALAYSALGDERDEGADMPSFYSVSVYDRERDPNKDLEDTVARATKEDKRILLFVGGDWCGWCKVFERVVRDNESLYRAMGEAFVVMKVDHARWGRNGRFLRRYPKAPGFPHFYVLEKDGSLLHSQGSRELETEDESSYNPESVLLFIDHWRRNSPETALPAAAAG